MTDIGLESFGNNDITELTLGQSVETIRADAFAVNALTELDVPAAVRTIGTIGTSAFRDNQLTTISLHEGITSLAP